MYRIRHIPLSEQNRQQSACMAYFTHTILCTTYNYNIPTKVSLRKLLDHLPEGLDQEERLEHILRHTAIFHERRHFHDFIGTTYGLRLFYYGQRILNQFLIECLPYLQQIKVARVPFVRWVDLHDCPEEIHAFVDICSGLTSKVLWLTTEFELPNTYTDKRELSTYAPHGENPIPVMRFSDNTYHTLGGYALEEGAAFVIENLLIREFFGQDYEEHYNIRTSTLPGGKGYVAALSFFFQQANSRKLSTFLSACDYGLNIHASKDCRDFRGGHPGWRFVLLNEQIGWKDTSSYPDAVDRALERLQKNAGWPSLHEVWEDAAGYCHQQIEHNQYFFSRTPSLIGFANLQYYTLAKAIFEKRMANSISYDSFESYVESLQEFPSPPLRRQRINGRLVITGRPNDEREETVLWIGWTYLWWIVQELVEGNGLSCLQDHDQAYSVDCFHRSPCGSAPGLSACSYGAFVRNLGLNSIEWRPVS